MIVAAYSFLKAGWSLANDLIVRALGLASYRPVPRYPTPEAAAAYLLAHAIYTGDPANGAVDFSIPAERLQDAMERGPDAFKRLHVDCDDFATWAVKALALMGYDARLITLRCRLGIGPENWGHHVIAVATGQGRTVGIDTNGFRELPDNQPATLCRVWSDLYKAVRLPDGRIASYVYVEAVETANPFA